MNFLYKFSAVRGIQAGKEYYISMVTLRLIPKLFPDVTESVLPEYRAQRRINEARIPEIRDYILNNRNTYVFSALSAAIDGNFSFVPYGETDLGILEVDMDAFFLINDGQHRKKAIETALLEDGTLENETISIVFFKDEGLTRSQQMFTDLNKHAVKTSNSLATLYDGRDQLAIATKAVINNVPFFLQFTDKERDILGKNSSNLFTLNMIYKANQRIIKNHNCTDEDTSFLIKYWNGVADNIVEWQEVLSKSIAKKSLRENYIVTLAITINALGKLGRYFYENMDKDMMIYLVNLHKVDWSRSNRIWIGKTIRENGKVLNNEEAVLLTYNAIKEYLGLSVDQ